MESKAQSELDHKENRIDELQRSNEELTRQLATQQKVVDQQKASIQKCIDVVKRLLIEKSTIEKKEARAKCMQNRLRLGQFVTQRVGATFQENWTDGYAFQVALTFHHWTDLRSNIVNPYVSSVEGAGKTARRVGYFARRDRPATEVALQTQTDRRGQDDDDEPQADHRRQQQ